MVLQRRRDPQGNRSDVVTAQPAAALAATTIAQPAAAAIGVAVAATALCAVHGPALTRYECEQSPVRHVERDYPKASKDMPLVPLG
jgi:hypothetical protein